MKAPLILKDGEIENIFFFGIIPKIFSNFSQNNRLTTKKLFIKL